MMRLRDGVRDETVADEPEQSNISTFTTTDLPLALGQQSDVHLGRLDTKLYAMPLSTRLFERIHERKARCRSSYLIEMHNRFAFPVACLVLMLVGVPLGVASRRGGKSSGFVFTILLVFVYYFLSSTGIALGHQNKLPAFHCRVVGEFAVCRGGHVSAVADGDRRANSERDGGVDCTDAETSGRQKRNGFALTRSFSTSSMAARNQCDERPGRGASFRGLSTSTSCANSPCSCWCYRLCFAHDCLHISSICWATFCATTLRWPLWASTC
jgi:hypothetical protein